MIKKFFPNLNVYHVLPCQVFANQTDHMLYVGKKIIVYFL